MFGFKNKKKVTATETVVEDAPRVTAQASPREAVQAVLEPAAPAPATPAVDASTQAVLDPATPAAATAVEDTTAPAMSMASAEDLAALAQRVSQLESAPAPITPTAQGHATPALYTDTMIFPHLASTHSQLCAASSMRPWNTQAIAALRAADSGTYYRPQSSRIMSQNVIFDQLVSDLKQEVFLLASQGPITSLDSDVRDLPAHWPRLSGVVNGTVSPVSQTDDVIQAFGDGWRPSNRTRLWAEIVSLQKVELQYEFKDTELDELERNWLVLMNQPKGSASQFKMPFTRYILMQLDGKRRANVREALINGVYAPNLSSTTPGYYLNSIEGLMKKISDARGVKYMPFTDLGTPSEANIEDYVNAFCERIYALKKSTPMYLYMSHKYATAYRQSVADRLQVHLKAISMQVEKYPSITLYPFDYISGDFMFATTEKNIVINSGVEAEENHLSVVQDVKCLKFEGVFNKGIHVRAFGPRIEAGRQHRMMDQVFFSNVEEIQYAHVPSAPDATTVDASYGSFVQLGENTAARQITSITGAQAGRAITLYGAAGYPSSISTGTTFIGAEASYSLSEGATITLMPLSGGKFAVVSYTAAATVAKTVTLAADATSIPAAFDGQLFVTSANTKATAIASIAEPEHAYDGFTITVQGGADTNASTIASVNGKIVMASTATLTKGVSVTLAYVAGVWYEIARS